jgi:ABC-type Fe3+-hydroxamate transport system substrate-binding protein
MHLRDDIDQLGTTIQFSFPPQRIVSLVPSQTEYLFSLGLSSRIVGVTKFCVHPAAECKSKTSIGGTKNFNFDVIRSLQPDLIIGNKEENYLEGIERLRQDFAVWMSDIETFEHAMEMMSHLAAITDRQNAGAEMVSRIMGSFESLQPLASHKTLYLIWRKPWMAAGPRTFIHDIMTRIGLENVIQDQRYPVVTSDELRMLNPQLVLLSSEPFPFDQRHIDELRSILPLARFMLVDGEMFSWYGSRLLYAVDYFRRLFN